MADEPKAPGGRRGPGPADERGRAVATELRRRGMSDAEIDQTLRKKKRRRLAEFDVLKSGHVIADPGLGKGRGRRAAREPATHGRLSRELCTVEEAAAQLGLHNRTVLRFIRTGRLTAAKVGKSYRIRRADLEAMAGLPPEPAAATPSVTSIIDIPQVDADLARRWSRTVTGALGGRRDARSPLRADVIHDPERSALKIVVVGAPEDAADFLALVRVWIAQLRP
ncbi:MAG TPA: helix-turn-helix domain-containing protein [Caulobacteraceae bacterium]|jgi:excisionase family DNA binding protein